VELALGQTDCATGDVEFVDAQFAFVGTVTAISGEIEPWDVDPENTDRPESPALAPWVTFGVDGWYTNDWGRTFSVWMPQHNVEIGQRLAVGGDARHVSIEGFSGQSGEVEFCSLADVNGALDPWDDFFGPSVAAGAGVPEGEPDAEDLATIDDAEQSWSAIDDGSYSYLVSIYDRNRPADGCPLTFARVVVEASTVREAIELQSGINAEVGCRIEVDDVPTMAEFFDLARTMAGATTYSFTSDLTNGTVLNFSASDRSVEVEVRISGLSESTAPTILGWDDVSRTATTARALWLMQSFDYELRIGDGAGERAYFDITSTVIGGKVVEVISNGEVVDPASLSQPWTPYTVDGLFDLIAEMEGEGNVAAVFDSETGAPINLWFDPILNGDDDELAKTVTVRRL